MGQPERTTILETSRGLVALALALALVPPPTWGSASRRRPALACLLALDFPRSEEDT
jgi:hypothetical protein